MALKTPKICGRGCRSKMKPDRYGYEPGTLFADFEHKRMKRIDVKYNLVRETVANNGINLKYISPTINCGYNDKRHRKNFISKTS